MCVMKVAEERKEESVYNNKIKLKQVLASKTVTLKKVHWEGKQMERKRDFSQAIF